MGCEWNGAAKALNSAIEQWRGVAKLSKQRQSIILQWHGAGALGGVKAGISKVLLSLSRRRHGIEIA